MRIISNFSTWKRVNEQLFNTWDVKIKKSLPGTNKKVKVKYIDGSSFKVKAVNDEDLVPEGGIAPTSNIVDAIVALLSSEDAKFLKTYPSLGNLASFYKDNFFTYSVKRDNDRSQTVVYSIQKRTNVPAAKDPKVKILSDTAAAAGAAPEAATIIGKAQQAAATKTADAAASSAKATSPIKVDDLSGIKSGSPLFNAIKNAYLTLVKNSKLKDNSLFPKVKTELKSGELGQSSSLFVKGLIAGFDLRDEYGDLRDEIDQNTANKIVTAFSKVSESYYLHPNGYLVLEQNVVDPAATKSAEKPAAAQNLSDLTGGASSAGSGVPADFNINKFLSAIGGGPLDTGDIKLPEGGLVQGKVEKGDATLKAFQSKVIEKFAGKKLSKMPLYKKFASYGADGNYGPTTASMVSLLKKGFELSDTSGSTITAELVSKLVNNKIDESYLGLNYKLVEQFNYDKLGSEAASGSSGKTSTKKGKMNSTEWKDLKEILEAYGSVTDTESKKTPGLLAYKLVPKDKNFSIFFYMDRYVICVANKKQYAGTLSLDKNFIQFDKAAGGKKVALAFFIKDPTVIIGKTEAKPQVTGKELTDDQLKSDVNTLVEDLDGVVTTDNLKSILSILQKHRNNTAVDDSDIDNPVTVSAIKRIKDLYSDDESGDSMVSDVELVGTTTLGPDGIKMKKQILSILSKY